MFFTVDEDDVVFLRDRWDKLSSFYSADPPLRESFFRILKEKYSEKSRFYHNLSHVKLLLNLLESLKGRIQDHHAVGFVIWFHDVIYDTKRDDNEEQSARLASETLRTLQVSNETIAFVTDLILVTRHHSGSHLPEDASLFLDMDLTILGMRKETYDQYSKAIRQEYSWVPELMYRKGRKKVLESFLERKRIYFTDVMLTRFEEQARENIQAEIRSLDVR